MSVNLEEYGINRLSVKDRLELIEQIWDSLPDQVAADENPEWHLVELKKRYENAKANPGQGKPWREVLDSLAKKYI